MSESLSPEGETKPDRVEVSVPLRTEFFATLRTMAAALGADAGFSIDEIDDLRLGISEVVGSFDSDGDGDRILAVFDVGPAVVTVTLSASKADTGIHLDELATGILNTVVDQFDVSGNVVSLSKRATEASEAPASDGHSYEG